MSALERLLMACGATDLPAPEVCWIGERSEFDVYWHEVEHPSIYASIYEVDVSVAASGTCIYAWTVIPDTTQMIVKPRQSGHGVADISVPEELAALVALIEMVMVKHRAPERRGDEAWRLNSYPTATSRLASPAGTGLT